MNYREKVIACDYLNNEAVHSRSITACNDKDALRVFEGMVTFRLDIIPQFIRLAIMDREIMGFIFEDHLAKELHFLNDFLPDSEYFDALRSQYTSTMSEYELTD